MIYTIFTAVFYLAFLQLLLSHAVYEVKDTQSARYLIRLINVCWLQLFGQIDNITKLIGDVIRCLIKRNRLDEVPVLDLCLGLFLPIRL